MACACGCRGTVRLRACPCLLLLLLLQRHLAHNKRGVCRHVKALVPCRQLALHEAVFGWQGWGRGRCGACHGQRHAT